MGVIDMGSPLTAEQVKLAEQQRHTEENLNALIAVVDDIVRRFPRTQ